MYKIRPFTLTKHIFPFHFREDFIEVNTHPIFKSAPNKCNDFMLIGLFGNIGFDSCDRFIEDCNKHIQQNNHDA